MKLIILIGLALASFCANASTIQKSVFSGKSFYYYDKEDRVQILKEFYHGFKSNYALWDFKKRRVNVDGDLVVPTAIVVEGLIDDVKGEFPQALSNLQFLDRTVMLGATFQDTHFSIRPVHARPVIFNGLRLKLVGKNKKVIISNVFDKVMAMNKIKSKGNTSYEEIKLFDEVISIDGVAIHEAMSKIEKYVGGSSKYYREMRSADDLVIRSYKYPMKNYSDFELKNKDGKSYSVRLPWFFSDKKVRRDTTVFFDTVGYSEALDLRFAWDEKDRTWVEARSLAKRGYSSSSEPVGMVDVTDWKKDKGSVVAIRTGYILKNAKAYGIVQLFSFSVKDVVNEEDEVEFVEVVRRFVKKLKEQGVPLIIDIRRNGGGSSDRARSIMKLIAKSDVVYPERTTAFKMTRKTRLFIQRWDAEDDKYSDIGNKTYWKNYIDNLYSALENEEHYSNVFAAGEGITADSEVGGFENKVVALVSPKCISACDNMAMLLKASGRVKLIGSHSNGTGAGFRSSELLSASWRDSYDIITARIPNYLFGYAASIGEMVIEEDDGAYVYNSENRPTAAHIEYFSSLADFTSHSSEWLDKAMLELEK